MHDFKELKLDEHVENRLLTPLAANLISKLCTLKPSHRYRTSQALAHPWITGRLNDEIPLT